MLRDCGRSTAGSTCNIPCCALLARQVSTLHLRRIRGYEARIQRESGAYVTQMLRAQVAYGVRHVARVHHANVARTCRATRDVTFGPLCITVCSVFPLSGMKWLKILAVSPQ
jgi:hypothetical protein